MSRSRHVADLIRTITQEDNMPDMVTSAAMRSMIEGWEGLRLTAYLDAVSVLTIGYGHTGPDVRPGMMITQKQADALLASDLARFEAAVNAHAKSPTQGQFDAMVSFAYNLGEGALENSTLLRMHNAGNFAGAADEFLKWNHAGGQVLAGLTRRREGERAVYLNGAFAAAIAPVLPASPDDPVKAAYKALQSALKAAGYDAGTIDGVPGKRTNAALAAWMAR